MSDQSHLEPFLINATTGSANTAHQRGGNVSQRREGESKVDYDFSHQDAGNPARKGGTLRRRFRRRAPSKSEPDPEEGKFGEASSPRDMAERGESKEGVSPAKPPLHSANSASSAEPNDKLAAGKAAEERKPRHRSSMPLVHHSNYIRKPDERLREKFRGKLLRSVADGIPEVHFIGEVLEGVGFKDTFVSCKWYLEWGKSWSFLAGEDSSQTQYCSSDDGVKVWNHPIDVHFATASMQGWPRIIVQVWELDEYGRSILSGYGLTHLPTNSGHHELEIHCWRPCGSVKEELQSFFLGTSSCLIDENMIFGKAWETRSQLATISSGIVKMNVTVILRFFDEQKVD